jgi:cephalosporin hydroxylase
MHNDSLEFEKFNSENQKLRTSNSELTELALNLQIELDKYKYGYSFSWCGIPVIRLPDDIIVFQELVWDLDPRVIVEIGVARGGSVILSSSLLHLLGNEGRVFGLDIDIRGHNRIAIEKHRLSRNVTLIEGDSTSPQIVANLKSQLGQEHIDILVLDSNHSHEHVYKELNAYADLVRIGGYIVLPDTVIEYFPKGYYSPSRPWDVGNNPMTALELFLGENPNFKIDEVRSSKAAISESPKGYIVRVH